MRKEELKKRMRGFTLIEVIIVLAIIAVILGFIVPRMRGGQEKAQALGIEKALRDIQNAVKYVKTAPECTTMPANKTQLINAVSDSLCRTNTSDGRGIMQLPQRIGNKNWTFSYNANTGVATVVVQGLDQTVGQMLDQRMQECTFRNGNLTCRF